MGSFILLARISKMKILWRKCTQREGMEWAQREKQKELMGKWTWDLY
jgi:hypothetical protein